MLRTLLESAGRRPHGSGKGTAVSVIVHSVIILAVVQATAASHAAPPSHTVIGTVIYTPPVTQPPRVSAPATRGGTSSTTTALPPLPIPATILTGVPPIDVGITAAPIDFGSQRPGVGVDSSSAAGDPNQVYFAQQVDKEAAYLDGDAPAYPELMRSMHRTGRVLAQFVVDTTGRVDAQSVHIIEATDPLFGASVAATMASMRFAPARVGTRAVPQLVQQVFRFTLR